MCITATMNKLRHRVYKSNDVLFTFFTPIDLWIIMAAVTWNWSIARGKWNASSGKWKRHPTYRASENYSVICSIPEEQNDEYWIIQCWKSWRILPKQRVVYIVYFYAILFYFVDYGIPLSQIKIVLFILANHECLIRRRQS